MDGQEGVEHSPEPKAQPPISNLYQDRKTRQTELDFGHPSQHRVDLIPFSSDGLASVFAQLIS